jgi:3-oxoacyl-(acyl-carrier-protein) synthase
LSRIVVTGLGVVSAVGHDVAENRSSLMQGKSGIGPLQLFPSKFSDHIPVGEVSLSNAALKEKLAVSDAGVTRTSLLALHAFNEAIADSGLTAQQLSSKDTALIGASTVGGICLTDEMYMDAQPDTTASEYLNSYDFAVTSLYLQKLYRIGGPVNSIHTACSSSANAIMYGARLLKSGRARRAIVGGFDSLAKFTINGFNALHILSSQHCMPFDEARNGLNLGEGAAFIVLEKEEDAGSKNIYASVSGYANTNDAFHASSLSDNGDGPYKAMEEALLSAKLNASQIDFINAHGTGTENNDKVESIAMQRVFDKVPAFASTKANTGHTLGAAAAIEAVYCVLNLYHQEVYPGLRFQNPIIVNGLVPVQLYEKKPLEHVMSNSFGFGGNCSSLIFSKA